MTYTVDRLDSAAIAQSYARLSQFTQIMCAGDGSRPEFKESNVKRAGGKFATKAEKAKMAEDAAAANMAAFTAAPAGEVQLPDGTKTYKLSKEQSDQVGNAVKGFADFVTNIVKAASTDPGTAVQDLEKQLAGVQADKVAKDIDALSPAAKKALAEKTAPAKAQAAAQVTKAIAANMSDDQVKKGLVAVTKQLNSGAPSKPEQVMEMIKGWAAEAQKNIDSGIKAIKSAGSDAKARALAAGTGLMTKIAEMAAAAQNSDAGKAIGNAASAAGSAIGEGLSNANQIGKDLAIDARQTAKRAEIGIKEAKKGALKTLGDAASGVKDAVGSGASAVGSAVGSAGKTLGDAANSAKKAVGDKVNEAGFSTNIKDLPGDLDQVGKDLVIDGRQTAKRAEIGLKKAGKSTLKGIGDAARKAKEIASDPELQSAVAMGAALPVVGTLAGAGIGGLVGGPVGAITGANIGNNLGAVASGANIGVGLAKNDPAYYRKEVGAIGNTAKNATRAAGELKDRAFKSIGDAAKQATSKLNANAAKKEARDKADEAARTDSKARLAARYG
jgi:trimeric autotransporter adhesin